MPWSDSQVRLFAAAAHNPEIAARKGIPQHKAREMEMEASPEQRSSAMKHGPEMQRAMVKRLRKGK
jgi:hypothetical protein